jgi:ATP-dependent RNA helicase DeaD
MKQEVTKRAPGVILPEELDEMAANDSSRAAPGEPPQASSNAPGAATAPLSEHPITPLEAALAKPQQDELAPFEFSELGPVMQANVAKCGWTTPLAVQAKVIPWLLEGRDIIVQSRTGSGKTGAFVLPLCEKIQAQDIGCQALIMVPTRELATQVKSEFDRLATDTGIRAVAVYGGVGYGAQLEGFRTGAQVVIGTPGRLLDHLAKGSLNLKKLQCLIIDEADELLSMGFYKDMIRIRGYCPAGRITALFSATIPESVKRLGDQFLKDPTFLSLSADGVHVSEMDHLYYVVEPKDKDRVLMRLIEMENPTSGIIFCNTRDEVTYVAAVMKRFGYDAEAMTGDVDQKTRELVMGRLKRHELRFLVATDIAARGIDVSHLEYVFIYDMHKDFDQYVHRAGRTGRAGNRGIAISLVSFVEEIDLKRFAKRTGLDLVKREAPTEEDVQKRLCERVMARLEADHRDVDTARRERMKRFALLAEEVVRHEFGREMQWMLLDAAHQVMVREGRPVVEPIVAAAPRQSDSPRHHAGPRPDRRPDSRGGSGNRSRGPRGPRR